MTTRRALLLFLAAVAVFTVASVSAGATASILVTDAMSVAATALLWRSALHQQQRGRRPWALISLGITMWVLGDLVWDGFLLATGDSGSPSPADVAYLIGYPLLAAGIVTMIRHRASDHWRSGLLDAVGVAIAASLAAWVFLVPASGGGSAAETMLSIAYPLADVVLLAALTWLVLSPGIRGVPSAVMLAGFVGTLGLDIGLSVGAISDGALGSWFDNAYPLTYLLIALAAAHRRSGELMLPDPSPADRLQPARVVFLGLALFSGPIIGTFTGSSGHAHRLLVLAATIGIGMIVLVRFLTALREVEESRVAISLVAGTDPLTGLDNRRRFLESGERCLARLSGDGSPAGVLMIDIDHFKHINDTYGHASGDVVLVELSRRCTAAARPFDLVGRIGGDEFAVVLADCGPEQTRLVAERLIALVAAEPFPLDVNAAGATIEVTLSVGGTASTFATMHDALAEADAALYEAKRRGRNGLWMSGNAEAATGRR